MPSNQDPWITPTEWMHTFPDSTKIPDSTKTPNLSDLYDYFDRSTQPDRLTTPGNCLSNPPVAYQYTSLMENEVRLLRIDPGSFESPLVCYLRVIHMERIITVVHEFQALSYAWGDDTPSHEIFLCNLPTASNILQPYPIRRNLYQALKHIRLIDDHLWIWVDALCIDQANKHEKTQQIPKMLDIYSCAWNVIAWLGDDESLQGSAEEAVSLVPDILNLKTLDIDLRGETLDENVLRSWAAFGHLLQQPWFERRWVIQEVACARKLSVRVADKILSWLDFADAIDLYSTNIDRIRSLYQQSALFKLQPATLDGINSDKAVALMQFSRNVFQKRSDSTIVSKLMSLESLVHAASSFAVSDIRDVIYALSNLAIDGRRSHNTPWASSDVRIFDYAKHPVTIFEDFVNHSTATSKSLDVLCRPWASWPAASRAIPYARRTLPSYIAVASFDKGGPCQRNVLPDDLLGAVGSQTYNASNASRHVSMPAILPPRIFNHVLQVEGIALNVVDHISTSAVHDGVLTKGCLKMLGWGGTPESDIDDRLWMTLVANRSLDARIAPTWYRRACALALSKLNSNGNLDSAALIADASQPSTLTSYLRRVQVATENKRVFWSETNFASGYMQKSIVGLGPEDMVSGGRKWACILYGSSVPVILRDIDVTKSKDDNTHHVELIGPCYVHGHMEGEIFAGMSEKDLRRRTTKFSIH